MKNLLMLIATLFAFVDFACAAVDINSATQEEHGRHTASAR